LQVPETKNDELGKYKGMELQLPKNNNVEIIKYQSNLYYNTVERLNFPYFFWEIHHVEIIWLCKLRIAVLFIAFKGFRF